MRRCCIFLLVLAMGPLASATAWSQASNPSVPPASSARPDTARPEAACPPGVGADAPTVGSGQSNANLSDKLARSGGIICPPTAGDSGMAVPPRDTGRMPVIPPPGTPGGDQSVKPK